MNSFKVIIEGTEFSFNTMNIRKFDLFQVYVQFEDRQHRFHMNKGDFDQFRIVQKSDCPEPFRHLEQQLSDAIRQQYKV